MKTYKDLLKEQKGNQLGSSPSVSTGGFRSQNQFTSASGKTLTGLDNQLALSGNLGTSYGQGVLTPTAFTEIGTANQKTFINTNKPGTKKGGAGVDTGAGGKDGRGGDTGTGEKDNTDNKGNSPIYGEPLTSIQTGDGGQIYFYTNGMIGYDFDGDGTVDFWDPRFFGKDFTGEFNYDMLLELLSYYSRLASGGQTEPPPPIDVPIGTTPDPEPPQPPIGTTPDDVVGPEVEGDPQEPDQETEEDIDRAGEFYDPVSNTLINLSYNPAQIKAYYRELYAFDGNGDGIPDWLVDGYKNTVEAYGIYALLYGLAPDLVYDDAGNLTPESLQSLAALLALSGFNNPLIPGYDSVFGEGSAFFDYFFGPGGIYEGRYEEFFGDTGGEGLPDDYYEPTGFANTQTIEDFFNSLEQFRGELIGDLFVVDYVVDDDGNYTVQFEYTINVPGDPLSGQPGGQQTFTNLYGVDFAPQDGIIDELYFYPFEPDVGQEAGQGDQQGGQGGDFGTQPG
jgi:hypothetical protein